MVSAGNPDIGAEKAGDTWNVLAGQVQSFRDAWGSRADPPDPAEFLPDGTAALRRLVLVELIKVDLDYRWSHGHAGRVVDDYVATFPELANEGPPSDLIYEEYHIRKRAGDSVQPGDYLLRYPDRADELARLLGLEAPHVSTLLCPRLPERGIEPGATIGDFHLYSLLGKGAFGRVFLARQRSMQRMVALKVSANTGHEPQTLAQLDHPNIVRVYDQQLLPERGLRLLYMQYVPGGTLQGVIDSISLTPEAERDGRALLSIVDTAVAHCGKLPPTESALRERLVGMTWAETVCWIGVRLAEALDYAHRRSVLHRDVKPANVLLTAEGSPQLADFNASISSKLDGASPAAFFGGSLAYMSPEQLEALNPAHAREANNLDGRSDLYSLCIILWELLAGRRPFPSHSLGNDWRQTLARRTEQRRAGVDAAETAAFPAVRPPGLDFVLLAGLDPDPARRPQTGADLARELTLCLHPRANSLLRPVAGGWRGFTRRHGLFVVLWSTIIPNALASICDVIYNSTEIIARVPGAEAVFEVVETTILGVAFPVGIVALAVLTWPATHAVRLERTDRSELSRRRCLILGDAAAAVSLILWLLAGIAYPISLCAALGPQPLSFFIHFMVSLTLCGLIAAIYPFFLTTFIAVRVLYPALVRSQPLGAVELSGIEHLKRRTVLYLPLAAVAPMLTVAAMVVLATENRAALGVLSAIGLIGFGASFALSRAIVGDLEAIARTARPSKSGT